MTRTILVTGGTGTLGRPVVDRLAAGGHDVRVLSRHARPADEPGAPTRLAVDLREGTGLDAAVDGVDTIVHCASSPTGGDTRSATNLIRAARRARVPHVAYISIVGVDRVGLGYYRTKLRVEQALEASGLGWTVLRTTQFHDLVLRLCAGAARLPVMPVPAVRDQPVASEEVAERLAELAAGDPAGRVPDMGGPRVEEFVDLARAYLRWAGRRRPLLPVRVPGATFAGFAAGGHLAPERAVGRQTFAEFLAARSGEERGR